jgi:homoserine dehydrogenase
VQQPTTVLKFGSSVLRTAGDLPLAVHEVYRVWREGSRVVAVVSALGATTDELLRRADQLGLPPEPEPAADALAALLATGEAASAALLTLALRRSGIPATLMDPAQADLRTHGDPLDAEPVAIDVRRLEEALAGGVVVIPGFTGRDGAGRVTVLGRGGSDLTAVFVAFALGARCTLVKDVDGLWTHNPAGRAAGSWPGRARRYAAASWSTAMRLGGGLVQRKALQFAAAHGLPLHITAPASPLGTAIGPGPDRLAPPAAAAAALRVSLLGCGTVGGGVLVRLLALPELFAVGGVVVRDCSKPRVGDPPADLFGSEWRPLVAQPADVLVELMGGHEPAGSAIREALAAGRHVVTANKAHLAAQVDELERLAADNGVSLRYSAAVGGALPALETVRLAARGGAVRMITGVVNGTTTFVLDQLAGGASRAEAVAAACAAGYAEADPTLDLNGTDAAQKLCLLARVAWGAPPPPERVTVRGIDQLPAGEPAAARAGGRVMRLVATCVRTGRGLEARVEPVALPQDHPHAVTGAGNALRVVLESGASFELTAQGAGRWPTTEAVMADLFDLWRERCMAAEAAGEAAGDEEPLEVSA